MRRALTVLTVCAAAATFAACAEEEGSAGSGGTGTGSSAGDGATNAQDAALKFARCMRENGVDMPDPKVTEDGGMVQISPGGAGEGPRLSDEDPTFRAAQRKCERFMEEGIREADPAARKEIEDKMLALAKCMRGEGIDFPDPVPGKGIRIERKQGEDPRFQAAQAKCHKQVGLQGPGRVGRAG